MEIKITIKVKVPNGATHYYGNLLDHPTWFKCTKVGVVGDHWWSLVEGKIWYLVGHHKPHWIKEIPRGSRS